MNALYYYSKKWGDDLEDRIAGIRAEYAAFQNEKAHAAEDTLMFEYISRRAANDDQEAIALLALVGDMSLDRWFA